MKSNNSPDADNIRLQLAQYYLKQSRNHYSALKHLNEVDNDATDSETLSSMLFMAAFMTRLNYLLKNREKDMPWKDIKPAYERVLYLAPESVYAARALYQLGRYYFLSRDFKAWRESRQEFIRRFASMRPSYIGACKKDIGDSYLFEGNIDKAREHYESLIPEISKNQIWLGIEVYLRLLQTSFIKDYPTPRRKVELWRNSLASFLGVSNYSEYDFQPWFEKLLKENEKKAESLPPSQWSECPELLPYTFAMSFYKGMFHNAIHRKPTRFFAFTEKSRISKKVDKANQDLRCIAMALEGYLADHCGGYPPLKAGGLSMLWELNMPSRTLRKEGFPSRELDSNWGGIDKDSMHHYLDFIPFDPFGIKPGEGYYYYTGEEYIQNMGFIIISRGPDGTYEVDPPKDYDAQIPQISPHLLEKLYDPTNGIKSRGDIFRVR